MQVIHDISLSSLNVEDESKKPGGDKTGHLEDVETSNEQCTIHDTPLSNLNVVDKRNKSGGDEIGHFEDVETSNQQCIGCLSTKKFSILSSSTCMLCGRSLVLQDESGNLPVDNNSASDEENENEVSIRKVFHLSL